MNGVRTVAGIFLILGWIAVVVGGLLTLGILFSLLATMRGNFNALMLMGSLTPLFMAVAASLSPFFLWAILRALIEIYDVQSALLNTMQHASAPSVPGAVVTAAPVAPSASAATMGTSMRRCPECGAQTPLGRLNCIRCRASI